MSDKILAAKQVTFAHLELGFHPAITRAKELIKNNLIGHLQNISITLHADWGCPDNSDLCLAGRMSCWYIDILNQLADAIPSQVLILDGSGNTGRMQPSSIGIYKYDNVWGIFNANVCCPSGLSLKIDIVGDCGSIYIDYFKGILEWQTVEKPHPVSENISPLKPYADYPGVREAVNSFLDAVSSQNVQKGNAKKVVQLNLIGLAAEESMDTGNWASVKTIF